MPWPKLERKRHDRELTPRELAVRMAKAIRRDKHRQARIAEAGMDYDYPALASLVPAKSKKITFE